MTSWWDDNDLSTREEPEGEPLWTALGIVAAVFGIIFFVVQVHARL